MKIFDAYDHVIPECYYIETRVKGPGAPESFDEVLTVGCNCSVFNCDCSVFNCDFPTCQCCNLGINYKTINNLRVADTNLFIDGSNPIIECNENCSCSRILTSLIDQSVTQENVLSNKLLCHNRYIQFGPLQSLQIFQTGGKGYGLRSSSSINSGQFICEYAGEVISENEGNCRRNLNRVSGKMNYVFTVMEHFVSAKQIFCVDPYQFGNIGRYINHSCEPNATAVLVRVSSPLPHICLFAVRDIAAEEEITFDYSAGQNGSLPGGAKCLCQSIKCRGYLPSE